ncbi:hypothetical protein ACFFP0_24865 [Rhizobium puerariae]|uniref:Uncharacterized protein n=1 Tax=Rhizobium puerariae TaxID=1585791 RepID=A0ABV6AN99_9HYPH
MSDIVERLKTMTTNTGRDYRSGQEFVHAGESQDIVDTMRDAIASIEQIERENAELRSERTSVRSQARVEAMEEAAKELDKISEAFTRIGEHPEANEKRANGVSSLLDVVAAAIRRLAEQEGTE